MTGQPVKVLLADDHAVVRAGTRKMLEEDESITVVGEAADGSEAVALAEQLRPDVVLLDVALPVLNGIQATEQIRRRPDPPFIVLLSAYDDQDYVIAAIEAGASGYLLKTAGADEMIAALRAAVRGEVVLHPAIARRLAQPERRDRDILTQREIEVVRYAAAGMGNREIAHALAVSVRTVEAQFTSVFNKLGVANRTEAISTAARRGWLEDERRSPP